MLGAISLPLYATLHGTTGAPARSRHGENAPAHREKKGGRGLTMEREHAILLMTDRSVIFAKCLLIVAYIRGEFFTGGYAPTRQASFFLEGTPG